MKNSFDQIGHKNLELLRFYLNKDIQSIDRKLTSNNDGILGYFIASLVDILIVVLFDDGIKEFLKGQFSDNIKAQIFIRCGIIAALILIFLLVTWIVKTIRAGLRQRNIIEGRNLYEGNEADDVDQRLIDRFDNVACDGLLVCQDYRQRYSDETDPNIKNFYLFEIIHYLKKADDIFSVIYHNKETCIALKKQDHSDQLIASYRVNNFIDFSNEILDFLETETKEFHDDSVLTDMVNLRASIKEWEKLKTSSCKS